MIKSGGGIWYGSFFTGFVVIGSSFFAGLHEARVGSILHSYSSNSFFLHSVVVHGFLGQIGSFGLNLQYYS